MLQGPTPWVAGSAPSSCWHFSPWRMQPQRPSQRQQHTGTVPARHWWSLGRRRSPPEPAVSAVVTHVRWDASPHVSTSGRFRPLVADTCLSRVYLKTGTESVLRAPPVQTLPLLWSQLRFQRTPRLCWWLHWQRSSALVSISSPETGEASCSSLRIPHLLSEQRICIAVLGVHLEPPPIVDPSGRTREGGGQRPSWVPFQPCAGSVRLNDPPASCQEACGCRSDLQARHAGVTDFSSSLGLDWTHVA